MFQKTSNQHPSVSCFHIKYGFKLRTHFISSATYFSYKFTHFHFSQNIYFNVIIFHVIYNHLWGLCKRILYFSYMKKPRHMSDNFCTIPRRRIYVMLYSNFWQNRSEAIKKARITGELKMFPTSSTFSTSTDFVR